MQEAPSQINTPEEPVVILHDFTKTPISSPTQWQPEEHVIND